MLCVLICLHLLARSLSVEALQREASKGLSLDVSSPLSKHTLYRSSREQATHCLSSFELNVRNVLQAAATMNYTRLALLLLSILCVVMGGTAHRLLATSSLETNAAADAQEHQRILAELEAVHQLRERMLQEGQSHYLHILAPCTRCRQPMHIASASYNSCLKHLLLSSPPARIPQHLQSCYRLDATITVKLVNVSTKPNLKH